MRFPQTSASRCKPRLHARLATIGHKTISHTVGQSPTSLDLHTSGALHRERAYGNMRRTIRPRGTPAAWAQHAPAPSARCVACQLRLLRLHRVCVTEPVLQTSACVYCVIDRHWCGCPLCCRIQLAYHVIKRHWCGHHPCAARAR